MRFINAVQADVKDRGGMPRPTRALLGEAAICLGGFELVRVADESTLRRAYSPQALAEHLERLREWNGLVQVDAEWDANDPELWQTSLTHPRTTPQALARTMATIVDLSVVYTAMRAGPCPFWYLVGASPYYKSLGNANALSLHTQDQRHLASLGLDAECDAMNLDAYRVGQAWEDPWQPAIIAEMVRVNRELWPQTPITISLCCTTIHGRALTTAQLKADLDACRKALARDGHPRNAIELWEGVHDTPAAATAPPYLDLWNTYVAEHSTAPPPRPSPQDPA